MRKAEAERKGLDKLPRRFIIVGEGGLFSEISRVDTLLGSCVAVTLFCPVMRIGAVFHALLPKKEGYWQPGHSEYRYVDSAIETLCMQFLAKGVQPRRLEAKVFGGASPLYSVTSVGRSNVESAFETLKKQGVRVSFSSVGGRSGRSIIFLPHTGEVYMKILKETEACPVEDRRTRPR